MSGVQRFLAGNRNAVRTAVLTATGVLESSVVFRTAVTRAGNGRAQLAGDYTGHEDAAFDIEILAGGTTKRVTEPVFAGVGSGALTDLSVGPAVAAQTFTITLADLGTDTTHAALAVGPVTIQAKAAGADGNLIHINVDESGLSYTDADFALLDTWPAGVAYQEGEQWSFNSQPLLPSGALAPTTKRYQIGEDLQIFRPYRKFESGKWRYYLTPTPERDLPKGARLREVTGARTVTVTNGTTPEPYASIVTLYDLLSALAASALVEVLGVVANDAAPGGQAAIDLPLKTSAYRLPVQNSGSANVRGLENVTVAPTAATENVSIECTEAGQLGRERWSVVGDVSGELPGAVTGLPYSAPRFGFTIPARLPPPGADDSAFVVQDIDYEAREELEITPPICIDAMTLGARAASKTITLVYKARPPAGDCECVDMPVPAVDFECLGLNDEEGATMSGISAAYSKRLTDVGRWYAEFCKTNTEIDAGGEVRSAVNDLDYARRTRDVLYSVLADLYSDEATRSWPAWVAESPRALDALGEPVARNGFRYQVDVAGTTGTIEPTWPTTIDANVADGTVTWRCVGKVPEQAFDDLMVTVKADAALLEGMGDLGELHASATAWDSSATGASITAGLYYYNPLNDEPILLKCVQSGTRPAGSYGPLPEGERGKLLVFASGGNPGFLVSLGQMHGSVDDINQTVSVEPGMSGSVDDYLSRYRAGADNVRAEAGIVKKSDAGSLGSDCWRDLGGSFWWEVNGKEYLPAFTNAIYYSVKRRFDAAQRRWLIEPTHEFAFIVNVKCPQHLKPGDTITLSIGNPGPRGYQVGDQMVLPIVAAQDAYLSGGVTGDDLHTWLVRGSSAGALANYVVEHGNETLYSDSGLEFKITRAGIPFALGDVFSFDVEASQFRWRKNGGAWSLPSDITTTPTGLSDGIEVSFLPGAAPSFVPDDFYSFLAEQTHAVSHITQPTEERWAWPGATATLTATPSAPVDIDIIAIARHTLPPGAGVTVEGSTDGGGTWPLSEAFTWSAGVMVVVPDDAWQAVDKIRLVISGATGGAIGWWWAGSSLALTHSADKPDLRHVVAMLDGDGVNAGGIYIGRGLAGSLEWDTFLRQADIDALRDLILHVKQGGGEPFILIPNIDHPDEAALVTVDTNQLDFSDFMQLENERAARRLSTTLPLGAVIE